MTGYDYISQYNQGLEKAREGKYEEALECLEESLKINPNLVEAHNLMGKVFYHQGDISRAKKSWQQALTIDPNNFTAKSCLEAFHSRKILHWIVLAISLGIMFFFLQEAWILSLNKRIKVFVETMGERQMVEVSAEFDSLAQKLDELKAISSDTKLKVKKGVNKKSEEANETAEDKYKEALRLYSQGKYDKAERFLNEIPLEDIRSDLKDNVVFWIGCCLFQQSRYEEALGHFRNLREKYPQSNKISEAEAKERVCLKKIRIDLAGSKQ